MNAAGPRVFTSMTSSSPPNTGMRPVASGCPATVRLGASLTDTPPGPQAPAGDISHPALPMARRTTGSRAVPASMTVTASSVGGLVGSRPVAAYQRALRQPMAADARTSSPPSSPIRAAGRERASSLSFISSFSCRKMHGRSVPGLLDSGERPNCLGGCFRGRGRRAL